MLITFAQAKAMFKKEKAHSKFSASGSERWLNCAASVKLEEPFESKDNEWTIEGTFAHWVLEKYLRFKLSPSTETLKEWKAAEKITGREMLTHVKKAAAEMLAIAELADTELIIERRVEQKFIHKEMFGTVDGGVPEVFGTLHIMDFKYGAGHVVSPEKNTQLIQYALGLAYEYDWNFADVTLHILQPRSGAVRWHKEWTMPLSELKNYWLPIWKKGAARAERNDNKPFEGHWCHWCKAKSVCPAKTKRIDDLFGVIEEGENGAAKNNIKKKETAVEDFY